MHINRALIVMAAALALPLHGSAQNSKDQEGYCAYTMEQAEAQRDLLRTPTALAGTTQPETGLPMQLVAGASLGLSSVRKASLTMDAARKDCELYKATVSAQQEIQYALPNIERDALRNRIALIDQASKKVDELMQQTSQMVAAQNATRLMLFTLQTTKIKLEADRADTQSKITAIYVPELSAAPLKDLETQKMTTEAAEQTALDKLTRQNNWDVQLSVGAHQQVNPVAQGVQPYGEVTINYNFASHAINGHLDRAAQAHDDWKKTQEGDVARNMDVLLHQLQDSLTVQENRLKSLQAESAEIEKNLELVATPDTSAALDFSNQLTAAELLLEIEQGDAAFRIDQLRGYLAKNY